MSTSSISQILLKKETISAINIFNPEHDLALAVGDYYYTPPPQILKLREDLALLPALFAGNGDFILVPETLEISKISSLKFYPEAIKKNIRIIRPSQIFNLQNEIQRIIPWGWDHALAKSLINSGINPTLIPSSENLEKIRNLSHRHTTIAFRQKFAEFTGLPEVNTPAELFSINEVERFLKDFPVAYFKAPWSSSGRGIVVSDHISRKGLLEWAHGVIKKQGSLMAEPAWARVLDFATEWAIKDATPEFLGVSVFNTSSRGKYHGNISMPQDQLMELIKQKAPHFNQDFIEAQRETLKALIAPHYSGPLGIDMLADTSGQINPCVEINLRLTMGLISLLKYSNPDSIKLIYDSL